MVDVKKITDDVETILIHSQDYPFDLKPANLILQWLNAKEKFIGMFGGETYVRSSKPIKICLSEEQRRDRFNRFMYILDENGVLTEEFEAFLRDNEKGFFDNRVLLPYPSFNIPLGSKLSKSFKRFISNEQIIRWAQDTASRYMQENKIEGYLYLSVDPRDFLTLSENNENWWSCQTLDGDYRAGNLSYMVDNTTAIVYLADDRKQHLKCLPIDLKWYSKKWRILIHTNHTTCTYYNRQYPYTSEDLLEEAYKFVTKALSQHNFMKPQEFGFKAINYQKEQTMLQYNQMFAEGRIYDTRDVIDDTNYLGYCDLISSSMYVPIVSVNEDSFYRYKDTIIDDEPDEEKKEFHNVFDIAVGNIVVCPCCGSSFLQQDNSFLCFNCIAEQDADEDFFLKCDSCYRRIYDEDEIFYENGIPYCKACHQEMMREDALSIEEDEEEF